MSIIDPYIMELKPSRAANIFYLTCSRPLMFEGGQALCVFFNTNKSLKKVILVDFLNLDRMDNDEFIEKIHEDKKSCLITIKVSNTHDVFFRRYEPLALIKIEWND